MTFAASQRPIFTIGHSSHSVEQLVDLLRTAGVDAVADVRSAPYSRIRPQFNRESLEGRLKQHGLAYVFLGGELGGRSEDPAMYQRGRIQYERVSQSGTFRDGIERVLEGSETYAIALLCAEGEPIECHRMLLVGRALVERGARVVHILRDGTLEEHEATLRRLVLKLKLPEHGDLFRSAEDVARDAYARQEAKHAYVVRDDLDETEQDTA